MDEPKFSEEHKKMVSEPILPIEKKLVAWSIGIGLVLLVILVWLTRQPKSEHPRNELKSAHAIMADCSAFASSRLAP